MTLHVKYLTQRVNTFLERVLQTNCRNVVGRYTGIFSKCVVIQKIKFVVNVSLHVFIEIVDKTKVNKLNQIL